MREYTRFISGLPVISGPVFAFLLLFIVPEKVRTGDRK